jgi:hypothetical protein
MPAECDAAHIHVLTHLLLLSGAADELLLAVSALLLQKGRWEGSAYGFGSARQRPPHVCIQAPVTSPGPVYMPRSDALSTAAAASQIRFGKQAIGSRFEIGSCLASNHPHWNPGPADYEARMTATGVRRAPGADAPKALFGSAEKMVTPQTNLAATVFLSEVHACHENLGVHSPGPAEYSPSADVVRPAAATYSLGVKAPSYFDSFSDPLRQTSPGPVYEPSVRDHKGST